MASGWSLSVRSVIRSTLIHICPTCSGPGFPRPVTSTPGLRAHSFPAPLIIFWWVTWPHLHLGACDGAIQVSCTQRRSQQMYLHSHHLCVCQINRWQKCLNPFWPFDLMLMSWSFAALKPEKGFLISMYFMFPLTKGGWIEDQYKQYMCTVNTFKFISMPGSLL